MTTVFMTKTARDYAAWIVMSARVHRLAVISGFIASNHALGSGVT
jgi:hypothetical protein